MDCIYFIVTTSGKFEEIKKALIEMVRSGLYENLIKSLSSAVNAMQGELQFVE